MDEFEDSMLNGGYYYVGDVDIGDTASAGDVANARAEGKSSAQPAEEPSPSISNLLEELPARPSEAAAAPPTEIPTPTKAGRATSPQKESAQSPAQARTDGPAKTYPHAPALPDHFGASYSHSGGAESGAAAAAAAASSAAARSQVTPPRTESGRVHSTPSSGRTSLAPIACPVKASTPNGSTTGGTAAPLVPHTANYAPMQRVSLLSSLVPSPMARSSSSTQNNSNSGSGSGERLPVVSRTVAPSLLAAPAPPLAAAPRSPKPPSTRPQQPHRRPSVTADLTPPAPATAPAAAAAAPTAARLAAVTTDRSVSSSESAPTQTPAGGTTVQTRPPSQSSSAFDSTTVTAAGTPLGLRRTGSSSNGGGSGRRAAAGTHPVGSPHLSDAPASTSNTALPSSAQTAPPLTLTHGRSGGASTAAAAGGEVPNWLAQVNTALMTGGAPAGVASQPVDAATAAAPEVERSAGLSEHRTFSQAAQSADDWLNPCTRPSAVEMEMTAPTPTVAVAGGGGAYPPGVVFPPGLRPSLGGEVDGFARSDGDESRSSVTDTASMSRSSTFADGGAGERRGESRGLLGQVPYPSLRSSNTGSLRSGITDNNGGFIPISRELHAMTPQSQRGESSGCLSLYSSGAADGEASLQGSAGRQPGAFGRRFGHANNAAISNSEGSGDVLAPVRLRRGSGGSDSTEGVGAAAGAGAGSANVAAAIMSGVATSPGSRGARRAAGGTGHHPRHHQAAPVTAVAALTSQPDVSSSVCSTSGYPPLVPASTALAARSGGSSSGAPLVSFNSSEMQSRGTNAMTPLQFSPPTPAIHGSAPSLLSNNSGPAMNLPLARFLRNPSNTASLAHPAQPLPRSQPPPHATEQRHQQQQHPPHTAGNGGSVSPVLSLGAGRSPSSPDPPATAVNAPTTASATAAAAVLPHWLRPTLAGEAPVTAAKAPTALQAAQPRWYGGERPLSRGGSAGADGSMGHLEGLSNASRATSGASLAAETQFIQYRD